MCVHMCVCMHVHAYVCGGGLVGVVVHVGVRMNGGGGGENVNHACQHMYK